MPSVGDRSPVAYGRTKGTFNVEDYGAVGDGSTDDTAAIQACLTAAQAGGGECFFPPGSYRTTSTISLSSGVSVNVRGSGTWTNGAATVIVPDFHGNVFSFALSSSARLDFRNMRIAATSARSSGAAVKVSGNTFDLYNVVSVYTYNGFEYTGAGTFNCSMDHCTWAYATSTACKLNATSGICGDWYFSNTNLDNAGYGSTAGTVGLWVRGASGIWFENMEINSFGTGVYDDPTVNTYVNNYCNFKDLIVDTCDLAVDINAAVSWEFSGCYFATSGGVTAVDISGGRNIHFHGGRLVYWATSGFNITGGSRISIQNVNFHVWPAGTTGSGKPLVLASGIVGVKFINNNIDLWTGACTFGGSHTYLHVEGNSGLGAAMSGTTTGTGNRVANNEVSGTWS